MIKKKKFFLKDKFPIYKKKFSKYMLMPLISENTKLKLTELASFSGTSCASLKILKIKV